VAGPEGWRTIELDDAARFAVPPDAQAQDVQPLDSIFGMLRGQGYEVIYDYGRFGEDLVALEDQPGYARRARTVDGRAADDVTFRGNGAPWSTVRLLHVADGRNHLTIRVSCTAEETCRLADDLFDSVRFR